MTSAKQKIVLGISAYFHDSAAALVQGNTILAAAQEERFTRKKADSRFPTKAIEYCLSQMPANTELEALAYYEDPSLKIDRIIRNAVANAPRGTRIWKKTLETLNTLNNTLPAELSDVLPDPSRIHFSPHHRSHAASAFYPSPFTDAAIMVTDGVGEWATASLWYGSASGIEAVNETRFPDSIGMLYSAFTQYCGFKVNSGEYKLMGLAPFGQPLFKDFIKKHLLEVQSDGEFKLNMEYFDFHTGNSTISPFFESLFKYPARNPKDPISMHHMNVAASIQSLLTEIMIMRANSALRLTQSSNLCMAGGVALNCVSNSAIAKHTNGLKGIWVQPAAGDAGGALGAALEISHQINKLPTKKATGHEDQMQFSKLGPSFTNESIESTIHKHGLTFESYSNNEKQWVENITQALLDGHIVGYFDGRMEFGPRALGNRSILADPRPANMLQRANRKIKFRETWRPLAPIILAEYENTLFNSHAHDPYMLFVSELKEQYRTEPNLRELRARGLSEPQQYLKYSTSKYPTVVHYDYSARTQSLSSKANPRLHAIMSLFHELTGCPMLLNTSFNVRGEPIVCSPEDAVQTFLNTHLDMLAIGPFIIRRMSQNPDINNEIGKRTFNED